MHSPRVYGNPGNFLCISAQTGVEFVSTMAAACRLFLSCCLAYAPASARGTPGWHATSQLRKYSLPMQLPPGVSDVVVGAGGYPRAVMLANGEWLVCVGMQVVSSTDGENFAKVGTVRIDHRKGRKLSCLSPPKSILAPKAQAARLRHSITLQASI